MRTFEDCGKHCLVLWNGTRHTSSVPRPTDWGGAEQYPIPGLDGWWGTPPQVWTGVTPSQVQTGGIPFQVQMRGTPSCCPGGTPIQDQDQDLDGGIPIKTGWGAPPSRTGCCPPPVRRQISIASSCYVVNGMPLAFTQENFLVH